MATYAALVSATTSVWFRDAIGTHTRTVTSATMNREVLSYLSITVRLVCP